MILTPYYRSNFPWLMSNARDRHTGCLLGGGAEYAVVRHPPRPGGRRIGVVGLIEEEWLATLATLAPRDVIFEDPVVTARRLCARLRAEVGPARIFLSARHLQALRAR
jgi:5'-nucleotidase